MDIQSILPKGSTLSPREYSPLALAFVGDAVYEVYVRAQVLSEANTSAHILHKKAIAYVKAEAQANAAKAILEQLSEDELAVFKRGRNAKSATVPKHANVSDYRHATALEALFGYLYLSGETERLTELMQAAYLNSQDIINEMK
ncbi:MAG: Mini-ribonuclease 3 [Clostridia bacterium]|nr:Mini-ribonuclease 3 [Clostridia bacterium]MBQ3554246.1 Mini-ribonuclease 3 [Clostridia bacterium]